MDWTAPFSIWMTLKCLFSLQAWRTVREKGYFMCQEGKEDEANEITKKGKIV